uniref:Phthiocerol/phthiodiolone dimycocerosyl transferase C-terminal domain-containing protein n=1 Tax=Chenopodium quinoa TaxID=63459 RepID=A0A803L2W3_CHEQI
MADSDQPPAKIRPIGGTENSWCKATIGGTGITVLSLLLNKCPDFTLLQNAIHKLQNSHPILRAKLHFDPSTSTFSLLIPSSSSLNLHHFDLQSTAQIILSQKPNIEESEKWAVMIKLHTGACDRTAAVAVMKELTELMMSGGGSQEEEGEVGLGVEEYIPSGKTNKPFWSRGVDMLGYSLNSFRLSNLEFVDPNLPRSSRVVRLYMDSDHTTKLLEGCKTRGIKLCGALSAAALIAARLSKCLPDGEWEKYAVVTLIDCRKLLEPALSSHHVGFYHSAILNTHDMKGGEELWELAGRTYTSFADAKNSNKHFSDMADLNFLMCRAIENPGLTPSSSLRTSFISVFEDPVIDETNENHKELGIEDYMGCASTHGVGPTIAIFDTVRQGKLDCACVYPFPLHSREQMQELVDNMKKILINCL